MQCSRHMAEELNRIFSTTMDTPQLRKNHDKLMVRRTQWKVALSVKNAGRWKFSHVNAELPLEPWTQNFIQWKSIKRSLKNQGFSCAHFINIQFGKKKITHLNWAQITQLFLLGIQKMLATFSIETFFSHFHTMTEMHDNWQFFKYSAFFAGKTTLFSSSLLHCCNQGPFF